MGFCLPIGGELVLEPALYAEDGDQFWQSNWMEPKSPKLEQMGGIFESVCVCVGGGVQLRSTRRKGRGGSSFGPNVKKPTSWSKKGEGVSRVSKPPSGPDMSAPMYLHNCITLLPFMSVLVQLINKDTKTLTHTIHTNTDLVTKSIQRYKYTSMG